MLTNTLSELFTRDLNRLKKEIELYTNEEDLWKITGEIKNSGGNLCLHLIGNLKTFIGKVLADSGYVRDRTFEFAGKNVPRTELYKGIEEAIEVVNQGLSKVSLKDLDKSFPIKIWPHETDMSFTLIHLHCHLNYHLGQINYHRRLINS